MIYSVSSALYLEAIDRLLEAVGARDYYSGTLRFAFEGAECRLRLSAIVCRERAIRPEGACLRVRDLVPVWWEFHTEVEGEERLNDFSFGELRAWLGR